MITAQAQQRALGGAPAPAPPLDSGATGSKRSAGEAPSASAKEIKTPTTGAADGKKRAVDQWAASIDLLGDSD